MSQTQQKLIFAVDDEQSIREVYKYALQASGFEVECFETASELFAELAVRLPDLVILDIMLDGMDGYEILKRLRDDGRTAALPVIMVSAKSDEIDKVRGLNLGADDYLAKPFGVMELVARINAKLRKSVTAQKSAKYKDIDIDLDKHIVTVAGKPVAMTLKQYRLLQVLVENAEKVVDRDKILDEVWGENYGETRTLDIHVAELRKMLVNSVANIVTVRGVGYSLQ